MCIFLRNEKSIGSGGNGAVYEVELDDVENVKFSVVANFLSMKDEIKKKRYNGFKNEIIALSELQGVAGIMEVIDKRCPSNVPKTVVITNT